MTRPAITSRLPWRTDFKPLEWSEFRSLRGGSVLLALALTLLAGCGRRGLEVVPVGGTITYHGDSWPRGGTLYFTSAEPAAGLPSRPAWAHFNTAGEFRATSFSPGDGLVPGLYRVSVEAWEQAPEMGTKRLPKSLVPEKYQSPRTSGLEIDVASGQGKVTVAWDVPKP